MEEDNYEYIIEDTYKHDLRSAAIGATGGFFGALGTIAGLFGAGALGVVGAFGAGALGGKPRHLVIGGLSSLFGYGAMTLGSLIGYNQGAEEILVPFSVGDDAGVVVQRGDGSQAPYVIDKGKYILFDKVLERDLSSKVEESDRLRGDYNARREAILNSIADDKQR